MIALGRRHWCLALSGALLLHAGVAVAVVWPDAPPPGAAMPGLAGLEISLGAAGGSPGASEPVAAPTVPVAPAAPAAAVVEPPPAQVEPAPPVETVQAEAVEVEPVEPVETVEPVDIVEAVEETPVEAVVAEQVVAVEPAPVPEARPAVPEPEPEPEPEQVQAAPEPPTVTAQVATTQGPETNDAAETGEPAPVGAAAPGAGIETGESTGDATPGGGTPGAVADYYALLQAWLEQHQRYPDRARSLRQEGVAFVFFVLDRQGRVLESRLERSSGYPLLDAEVLDMVARADPLPPMPADMDENSLALVLPVAFTLR